MSRSFADRINTRNEPIADYGHSTAAELVADGHTQHATVDAGTRRPTRLPPWFAEAVARAEEPAAS